MGDFEGSVKFFVLEAESFETGVAGEFVEDFLEVAFEGLEGLGVDVEIVFDVAVLVD